VGFPSLLAQADGVVLQLLGGDLIRYAPGRMATPVDFYGLFDSKHQRTDAQDITITTAVPAVFIRLSDIAPNDPETDELPTVTVNATMYRVRETRKDGQGGALLLLQEMGP
jgi:hypothetical protein